MKVLQSHGTSDTLLPYPLGLSLKEFFEKSEMEHEFVSFQGVHTIGEPAVRKFIEFVGKLTSK